MPTVKLPKARSDVAGAQVKKHKGRDWNDAGTCSPVSAGAQRGSGGRCVATGGGKCNDIAGGWMDTGNEFVGSRVRRCVREEEQIVGFADGKIVGWLPAEKADYVSDITHKPGALWHVRFDDETVGDEDLEEFEVHDAIDSLRCNQWADMGENRGGGCGGAAQRSFPREGGRGGRVGADGEARGVTSDQGGDLQVC